MAKKKKKKKRESQRDRKGETGKGSGEVPAAARLLGSTSLDPVTSQLPRLSPSRLWGLGGKSSFFVSLKHPRNLAR